MKTPHTFASIATRITGLTSEQTQLIVQAATQAGVTPWQVALEQGQLNATDVDIIRTLLAPRDSVPGYEILDLIGRGGMGVVYRARQLSLNREVALKTILLSQLTNPTTAARFENEAQLLARLTHPHIVAAFDFGRHAGRLYLAMELVEGKDVERLIRDRGRLPERFVWHVIRQGAAGLAHAARAAVIHRDIKPANLLLVQPPDGFPLPPGVPMVKIADFGLSILEDEQRPGRERLTSASVHIGSPTYMAPEQLESGDITHAADIFALGATAWHMLVGHAPLQGSSLRQLVMQRLTQPTEPLDQLVPEVSSDTVQLVSDMLRIDPTQRIQSYDHLLQRIDRIVASSHSSIPQPDPRGVDEIHDSWQLSSSDLTPAYSAEAPTQSFRSSPTGHSTPSVASSLNPVRPAQSQSGQVSRRRWRWLAPLAGLLLMGLAWWLLGPQKPVAAVRLSTMTGERMALFDGSTLAGWSISSGSWFPGVDSEGAAVLQGTAGAIRKNLSIDSLHSFPDYFALEASCRLETATSAQLKLQAVTELSANYAIAIELSGEMLSVFEELDSVRHEKVVAAPWSHSNDAVQRIHGIRLERQINRWWVLVDGQVVSTFESAKLSTLTAVELSAQGGTVQFADMSLAALRTLTMTPDRPLSQPD